MRFASVLAAFLCVIFVLGAPADSRTKLRADKTRLIALENAWNQAQLNHDGRALQELVAENFIYTDYDGTVMNKQQFIEDIKDQSYKPTLVTNDGERVFPYENAAIVIGTYHTKGTYKGKPFEHFGRFTDTWIMEDGKWQCVASHTNLIDAKKAGN